MAGQRSKRRHCGPIVSKSSQSRELSVCQISMYQNMAIAHTVFCGQVASCEISHCNLMQMWLKIPTLILSPIPLWNTTLFLSIWYPTYSDCDTNFTYLIILHLCFLESGILMDSDFNTTIRNLLATVKALAICRLSQDKCFFVSMESMVKVEIQKEFLKGHHSLCCHPDKRQVEKCYQSTFFATKCDSLP